MIVKYEPEHAYQILEDNNNTDLEVFKEQAVVLSKSEGGMTLMVNDAPMLCTGTIELWDKVAEAWLIVSNRIHETPLSIARKIKRGMLLHFETKKYERVQANVRADWPVALSFSKFCDFERDGYMKKFGPEGADYVRFAWVQ